MRVTIPGFGALGRRASRARTRTVNLMICGARRSGTTSLEYYLQEHPEIAYLNERAFQPIGGVAQGFPYNSPFTTLSDAPDALESYEKVCARVSEGAKYIGWRSVYAMYFPHVIYNLFEHLSDVKLLFSLRNPVETCYSVYCRQLGRGREQSFEEMLKFQEGTSGSARPRWSPFYRSPQDVPELVSRGIYAPWMRMFISLFGSERVHVYPFEQMVREPEATIRGVLRFLDLDDGFHFTRLGEVRSSSTKPGPMNRETRAKLAEFYRPFNEDLFAQFGWPPNGWSS